MSWWMGYLPVILVLVLLLLVLLRQGLDEAARRGRWRIGGRVSDVLPGWHYPRCVKCGTSFRYVPAHELAYQVVGRPVVRLRALCDPCVQEMPSPVQRIGWYVDAWERMAAEGDADQLDLQAIRLAVQASYGP